MEGERNWFLIKSNILKYEGNVERHSKDNDDEEDATNRRAGRLKEEGRATKTRRGR